MFLLWVVNIAVVADDPNKAAFDDNPYPSVQDVGGIPACADDIFTRSPCWDFYFSPNTSAVVQARAFQLPAPSRRRCAPTAQRPATEGCGANPGRRAWPRACARAAPTLTPARDLATC